MAIKLIKNEWCPYARDKKAEYIIDTDAEVTSLPQCCAGSSAICPAAGTVYVVNASGNWVEFGGDA